MHVRYVQDTWGTKRKGMRSSLDPSCELRRVLPYAGDAGWDYDVEAQAIQARLLDLNAIMPGALRKLDSSRMAAAAVRHVRLSASNHGLQHKTPCMRFLSNLH